MICLKCSSMYFRSFSGGKLGNLKCVSYVSFYRQGRHASCFLTFLYAVIGQNLAGEFMRKIYAAS